VRVLAPDAAARSGPQRLWRVFSLIRYRFFLFAGLLPYLLGAAWAFASSTRFDAAFFWMGLGA
jgi:1,4-dihydroxy-2-naphthoate polyprenyltransferase